MADDIALTKPELVVDRFGDFWERGPNGSYDCDEDVWIRRDINADLWVCLTDGCDDVELPTTEMPLDRVREAFGPLRVYEVAYRLPSTPD